MLTEILGTAANTPWKACSREEKRKREQPPVLPQGVGCSACNLGLPFSSKLKTLIIFHVINKGETRHSFHCRKRLEVCKGSTAGRGAGRKHGVMLVVNRMWLALGETSPSSSTRVFDDTSVALPKETRPLLGHLRAFNFSGNLSFPSWIL